jgi:superfamily II DNA or RNA helicase
MLKDTPFEIVYSTGEKEPIEFFFDALIESNQFDLGLGFFSSTAINVLSAGFAYFIHRGGRMRVIINDVLPQKDKEAIESGIKMTDVEFEKKIIEDISKFTETLSKQDEHFFKCLSYLISINRIEFIATIPINEKGGIAHNKYGIFTDEKLDKVVFNGSTNFSKNSLLNNVESISCYTSWTKSKSEFKRLKYFEEVFNKTWEGESRNIQIIPIEKVKGYIKEHFPVLDIEQLLEEEKLLLDILPISSNSLKDKIKKLYPKCNNVPHFPFNGEPRNYQIKAYENWVKNNYQGIFAMATGTGKTITSLNCVLQEYNKTGGYNVLILVPTTVLLEQWIEECAKFNFPNVITSLNEGWKNLLSTHLFLLANNISSDFIFITTYATFNRKAFQVLIRNKKLSNLILICDEAHNLGSNHSLKNLPNNIIKRIGLSATPNRVYDERGSKQLEVFFNSFSPNYTSRFSMKNAIEQGYLTKYEYYPTITHLNYNELLEYKEITKELIKHFDFNKKEYKESASFLLIKRKRIIHQAENKKKVFEKIIKDLIAQEGNNLKHVLVYVPEGFDNNYSVIDSYTLKQEDQRIINEYSRIISKNKISTYQLLGETKDREEVLKRFGNGKISVLTAMKTLDEGVDIPATKYAIFCASTGNPRQFIQRRGRVLRKFQGKDKAVVYDIVVAPNLEAWDDEPIKIREKLLNMEINIFKNELNRVANFLYACDNRPDISIGKNPNLKQLVDLAYNYEINLDGLINDLEKADN